MNVTYRGREVRHPVARAVVVVVALLGMVVALVGVMLFIVIGVPLCLLLQAPLRLSGRRGTVRRSGDSLGIKLDREAFRRVL